MTSRELEKLGEASLSYEKKLIGKILLAKMNGEDTSQEIESLMIVSQISNYFINLFLATNDDVYERGSLFENAVSTCDKYSELKEKKKALEKEYSPEADISYRTNRLNFDIHFTFEQERVKRLLFYYEKEENKPDAKEMVNQFLVGVTNVLPIRNYLLGKRNGFDIKEQDVSIMTNKDFLNNIMYLVLAPHRFNWASQLIDVFCNRGDIDKVASASFLNYIISLSIARDLGKKYGIHMECFDGLEEGMETSVFTLPGIEEHPEIMSEIEHIQESVDCLSEKYQHQDQK